MISDLNELNKISQSECLLAVVRVNAKLVEFGIMVMSWQQIKLLKLTEDVQHRQEV